MQIIVKNLRVPVSESVETVIEAAKKKLKLSKNEFISASLHKRSVDARRRAGHDIELVCSVTVECNISESRLQRLDKTDFEVVKREPLIFPKRKKDSSMRPVVVGFGPCGMFAALMLAENGYEPIVIERGGNIEKRRSSVEIFNKTGKLDLSSNIQFGAGGAGTFSDGKLVTRINDPRCQYVLERLKEFGAPDEILTLAKPHIGTDKLVKVVEALRARIVSLGGEVRFMSKLVDMKLSNGKVVSVTVEKEGSVYELETDGVIFAVGHSARDTYDMLDRLGVQLISKPFSVGVRVEHLQSDIDRMLYGENAEKYRADRLLPPGEYALSYREKQLGLISDSARGVYSFCMCPGGEVVAAASEECGVVTNGMSRYARDGRNANSAIAVSVFPEDIGKSWRDGINFQRQLETAAYKAAGENFNAPIELLGDFLEGRTSKLSRPSRVMPTYRGGDFTQTCDISALFPSFVSELLKTGFRQFGRKMKGFDSNDALLTGVETRTSAPVRIPRTDELSAYGIENLYPCGEGAGYAGGITSAAVDGIRAAFAYADKSC